MQITNTVIMALAGLLSFGLSAGLGKVGIPWLHRLKFGQTIREEGPSWHQKKQGTPTMGGLLFIAAFAVTVAVAVLLAWLVNGSRLFGTPYATAKLFGGVGLALGCGLIGFADDYIKVVKKRNLGLTALQKLLLQLALSTAYAVLLYTYGHGSFFIPFFGQVEWGIWFIPFTVFVIVAVTNATNLTDGVDGLCGLTAFVAALTLLLLCGLDSMYQQSLVAVSLAGALAGFLLWNLHPAQVFMGDTGSLFIGGALTALAFAIDRPFLLIPIGILYIAENLSVILQVVCFKATHGKRLFKMSPLHHHFELCGWSENKIVLSFTAVTLVGCIAAVLLRLFAR
ncbi:MAG: phospho-N-acetylmuramoyl-pentapeptide-transferase [Clostridia bacterium]|nr:phospho-N-acetylmuramoyl-pentapeptide-transferase [Clostridia bacterium]